MWVVNVAVMAERILHSSAKALEWHPILNGFPIGCAEQGLLYLPDEMLDWNLPPTELVLPLTLPGAHWLAKAGSSIGWLPKPLSTVWSEWQSEDGFYVWFHILGMNKSK